MRTEQQSKEFKCEEVSEWRSSCTIYAAETWCRRRAAERRKVNRLRRCVDRLTRMGRVRDEDVHRRVEYKKVGEYSAYEC